MAIIPRGQFRTRANVSGQLQLPSDGASAPYHELTKLGGQMATLGATMYTKSKSARDEADTNDAKTEYAKRATLLRQDLSARIDETGRVGDGVNDTYSAAIERGEKEIREDISGRLSDVSSKSFMQGTASASRGNIVGAITSEHSHVVLKTGEKIKKDNTNAANDLVLDPNEITMTGWMSWQDRIQSIDKQLESGAISVNAHQDYIKHSGQTTSKAMADTIVKNADVSDFVKMFGGSLFLDPRFKAIVDQPEFFSQKAEFEKALAEGRDIKGSEIPNNLNDLTNHLTPTQQVNYVKQMLGAMKAKTQKTKIDQSLRFKNLLAGIREEGASADMQLAGKNLLNDMRSLVGTSGGITPLQYSEAAAAVSAEKAMYEITQDIALESDAGRKALFEKHKNIIKDQFNELSKDDPIIREVLKDESSFKALKERHSIHLGKMALKLDRDFKRNPTDYVLKYDTTTRNLFDKIDSPQTFKLYKEHLDASIKKRRGSDPIGVQDNWFPSAFTASISKAINESFDNGDSDRISQVLVSSRFNKNGSTKFNLDQMDRMLAEALSNDGLPAHKKDVKAIRQTVWMTDPKRMSNAIESLINLKKNKKSFADIQSTVDADKRFNLEGSIALEYIRKYGNLYAGNAPSNVMRRDSIHKLIEGHALGIMGTDPQKRSKSENGEIVEESVRAIMGHMYVNTKVFGSDLVVPNSSFKHTPKRKDREKIAESAARNVLERAKRSQIDVSQYPHAMKKLGTDPKTAAKVVDQFIKKDIKIRTDMDSDEGGMTAYVNLPGAGLQPLRVKKTKENPRGIITIPFARIEDDPNVLKGKKELEQEGFIESTFKSIFGL